MQMTVTLYIVALNIILAGFSDEAVTILGLYYKIQTFFFIPLLGLQTCIVPALSYNYGRGGVWADAGYFPKFHAGVHGAYAGGNLLL